MAAFLLCLKQPVVNSVLVFIQTLFLCQIWSSVSMAECQFALHHMEALLPFILVDAPILVHICRLFQTRGSRLARMAGR